MPYVLPGGRKVSPDMPFVLGEIQYPPNWLRHATQADKDAIGITWENDPPPVEPVIDLAKLKAQISRAVDDDAERYRLKFISPGDGMQMTYREKLEQAHGVNAMGEAAANALTPEQSAAQFPTLAASVGIEGASLWAVAQLVLTKYAEFAQISFFVERKRLGEKKAIGEATSVAQVKSIYDAVIWPE